MKHMAIEDLVYHNLLQCDLIQICLYTAYCAYHAVPLAKRPETRWLAYLGAKTGSAAERLVLEAVGLLNDISVAAQYAEEYVAVHPGLYLSILEKGKY